MTEVYEEEEDNDENEPQPKAHEIELSLDETPVRESKASDMRVEIATGEKADLLPSGGEPAFEIDEKTSEEDEAYTGDVTQPYNPRLDLEHYKFPTLDLLNTYNDNEPTIDMEEQNANKDRIIKVLRSFGIEISSIKASVGPVSYTHLDVYKRQPIPNGLPPF